jgi:hypothetical protein
MIRFWGALFNPPDRHGLYTGMEDPKRLQIVYLQYNHQKSVVFGIVLTIKFKKIRETCLNKFKFKEMVFLSKIFFADFIPSSCVFI